MKESLECEMVRDLLPNYIEELTSEKTNKVIEEHLENCKDCRKVYQSMKVDLNIKENEDIRNKTKVKIFRKINKRIKILETIIITIIVIYLGIYTKNLIILNKMVDLSESNNFNNYYQKSIITNEKYSCRSEYYQNNDNFLNISIRTNSDNTIDKIVKGKFKGEYFYYYEENGIDKTSEYNPSIETKLHWRFTNKAGNLGLALIPTIVKSSSIGKKECYRVELENDIFFIDKETGMEIKKIYSGDNTVYDDEFSFGTVTDEQIEELRDNYIKK